jgi:hypothetical protein
MSPNGQALGKNISVPDNVYTIILAFAFCAVLATAVFVAIKTMQYCDSFMEIFKVP